jgi:hypothetical protein
MGGGLTPCSADCGRASVSRWPGWRATPAAKDMDLIASHGLPSPWYDRRRSCIRSFWLRAMGGGATAGDLLKRTSCRYSAACSSPCRSVGRQASSPLIINALKGSFEGSLKRWLRPVHCSGGVGVACPLFLRALGLAATDPSFSGSCSTPSRAGARVGHGFALAVWHGVVRRGTWRHLALESRCGRTRLKLTSGQLQTSQLNSSVLRLLEGGTRLQAGVVAFGKVRLWLW